MPRDPLFDDEVWDEERWEAYLREDDLRRDRYMDLMFAFLRRHPRPDPDEAAATDLWEAELRAFLEAKGWRRGDGTLPFPGFEDLDETPEEDPDEEVLPLREQALWDDDRADDDLDGPGRIPIYRNACALTTAVLEWAHGLSGEGKDSTLVHFCTHLLQVPAHVAKGHSLGYERETLGGNIACAKRALAAANAALDLFRQMKEAPYMDGATYRRLNEQTFEVRNGLALYILELRDRFDLGID
jgi:hypothetical protein